MFWLRSGFGKKKIRINSNFKSNEDFPLNFFPFLTVSWLNNFFFLSSLLCLSTFQRASPTLIRTSKFNPNPVEIWSHTDPHMSRSQLKILWDWLKIPKYTNIFHFSFAASKLPSTNSIPHFTASNVYFIYYNPTYESEMLNVLCLNVECAQCISHMHIVQNAFCI